MRALLALALAIGAFAGLAQAPPADPVATELALLDVRAARARSECNMPGYARTREDITHIINSASPENRARGREILARHPDGEQVNWQRFCPDDERLQVAIRLYDRALDFLRQRNGPAVEEERERARALLVDAQRRYNVMRQAEDDGIAVNEARRQANLNEIAFLNAALGATGAFAEEIGPEHIPTSYPQQIAPGSPAALRLTTIRQHLAEAERMRAQGYCYAMGIQLGRAREGLDEIGRLHDVPYAVFGEVAAEYRQIVARRCAGPEAVPQAAAACPAVLTEAHHLSLNCRCPAGPGGGAVFGNHYYSAESGICRAALHAGAIGPRGGSILARIIPGRTYYVGKIRNGVTSQRAGPTRRAIVFDGTSDETEERLARYPLCQFKLSVYSDSERSGLIVCRCLAGTLGYEGTVYGSGPYTSDSSLCWAARHAGALRSDDDLISARALPARGNYVGSLRNGVRSENWEPVAEAMRVSPPPVE